MNIEWIGCPGANFSKGRRTFAPVAIVIHIMDGSFTAGESTFTDPTTQKSAHYGISQDGAIHQYVDESDTAYHAGTVVNPTWTLLKPRVNPNFYTVGIEHEGRADDEWPEAQFQASGSLIGEIATRWRIPIDSSHIIGHHMIRANKTCPGNWIKLDQLLNSVSSALEILPVPVSDVNTLVDLCVRKGSPLRGAPTVRVVRRGTGLKVVGYVRGERINGNGCWYLDSGGNYIWAGGTNIPDPQ